MDMTIGRRTRTTSALALAGLLALAAAGCNDFLRVENPGAIEAQNVGNPFYTSLLVNGVIGRFQPAFSSSDLYSAIFSDELANFHGFVDNIEIDRRAISYTTNGTYSGLVYGTVQRSRFFADTTALLLKSFLGDTATRDVRLARVLAYAGYSYTLLADQMCAAPIGLTAAYTPEQLYGFALDRFKEAITVAGAAKGYNAAISPATTASKANALAADSILNLAQVGAARVSLDIGKMPEAISYASTVPAGFEFRVYHSANSAAENNPFYGAASGGANAEFVGLTNTPFDTVRGDPRIPRPPTTEGTQQGPAIVPNSPLAFSTYNGTVVGADFTKDASIRFASGLEAQYIVAEAQGLNATNLAFVNSRRQIGGQLPLVAPTDAEYMAALREQRARDLYLANYRLGDLRRYKKLYGLDLFQSGAFASPVPAPPTFGDQQCFPIPLAEYNGNPNLPRP